VHHSKFACRLTAAGQNLRLPQCNIGIRFTPISRHYAHKMAADDLALLAGQTDCASAPDFLYAGPPAPSAATPKCSTTSITPSPAPSPGSAPNATKNFTNSQDFLQSFQFRA
jgi:hypothetical protein